MITYRLKKGKVKMEVSKNYITVEEQDYQHLVAVNVRMGILWEYVSTERFIDKDTIKLIIGMERKEKDNG